MAISVKSGFWGDNYAFVTSHASPMRRRVATWLGRKSLMPLRAEMAALNGVAPGGTASKTLAQIEAHSEQGGKRVVEVQTLINRATTTADRDDITATILTHTSYNTNPPKNKDLNPLGGAGS